MPRPAPQLGDDLDQMFQAAPEPVQPPDHQGVAEEQRLQELIELRPTVELPDAWSVNSNAAGLDKGVLLPCPARSWTRGRSRRCAPPVTSDPASGRPQSRSWVPARPAR